MAATRSSSPAVATATNQAIASGAPATTRAPESLGQMVLEAARRNGASGALDYPDATGKRRLISYAELGALSREIARGLMALGVRRGEHVAILATTRAEWTLVDCGALCAGAVVVPVYHTNSPEECAHVLAHSRARLVFCEDPIQAEKVRQVRERCPRLEHVVLFEGEAEGAIALGELRRRAAEITPEALGDRITGVRGEDTATIVYTSGTTGPPKGCVLTHSNLLATARMYAELLSLDSSHVLFQFLPLAHVLARVAQLVALDASARIAFAGGDPSLLLQELAAVKPTHFPAVPRVYEKAHAAIVGTVDDGSPLRRLLFGWALAQGTRARRAELAGRRPRLSTRVGRGLAETLVLSKVRRIFGGRLQLALVGAAPVAQDLLEFFDACGVPVLEGYGMTESCAAATLNTPRALRYGTVGRPLPRTDVATAPDGEILLHGPHVFAGYYRDHNATRRAVSDGWLHTGDLGVVDADGFLRVTGRKKELIITSSGKNIAPANIENALRETRWVSEAVVYGDRRPYLVAIVTLDHEEGAKLAERLGIAPDIVTLSGDPQVREQVQQSFDEVNGKLARIEQVKRFAILDHDLTQARGELTPTLKVKRELVYDRYGELFAGLYEPSELSQSPASAQATAPSGPNQR